MQLNGFSASKKRVFRAAESICAFFSFRKKTAYTYIHIYAHSKLVISSPLLKHTLMLSISRAIFYIRYTRGPLIFKDAVVKEGRSALGRYICAHNSYTEPR